MTRVNQQKKQTMLCSSKFTQLKLRIQTKYKVNSNFWLVKLKSDTHTKIKGKKLDYGVNLK